MSDGGSSSIEQALKCKVNLRIGTWNCNQSYKMHKKEIDWYCLNSNCDIVALQQLSYAPSGKVEEREYIIYFTDRNEKEKTLAFFVKKNKVNVDCDPERHASGDIAMLKFEFSNVGVQLFNIHREKTAGQFYEELKKCYKTEEIKNPERLNILCGTFNSFPDDAYTGRYDPFILREVYHTVPEHNLRLVSFLKETRTYHLNSRFHKDLGSKWTWRENERIEPSKFENDGFLSNRPDMVRDVDVELRNEGGHRMVFSDWNITEKSHVTLERELASL